MSTANRIEELRQKFDENPRRYFAPLANEYRKAGDLAQAIALCREHLPKQPGHMSGYIVFGQALFEANELDEAREVFEQALSLDPENLIALRHLGDIALAKNRPSLARRWYERVLDADPRNDDIAAQLMTLANMSTPRGGLPAIAEDAPAAAPAATTAPVTMAAPVVELPPARFTPRNFEPIDIEMPAARSMPTPAYPPRAIEVPPIPTEDAGLRVVEEFPTGAAAEHAQPIADALHAFAAFDPAHTLEDEANAQAEEAERNAQAKALHVEPIEDDVLPWNEPTHSEQAHHELSASHGELLDDSVEFEEGLVAPTWPDTHDLVARIETPMRSATPIGTPISTAALDAFGREQTDVAHIDVHEDPEATAARILAQLPDRMFASGAFASVPETPRHSEPVHEPAAPEHDTSFEAAMEAFESEAVANIEQHGPDGDVAPASANHAAPLNDAPHVADDAFGDVIDVAEPESYVDAIDVDAIDVDAIDVEAPPVTPPTPAHEFGIQLVSMFDERDEPPAVELTNDGPNESVAIDDDQIASEADAAAPYEEDMRDDLPWIAAVEPTTHVDTGLGEPSFAEYETAGDEPTIADQFADAFEASSEDSVDTARAESYVETNIVSAIEVDDSFDATTANVSAEPQATVSEVTPHVALNEASFADVIDDEMLRAVESSEAPLIVPEESFADYVAEEEAQIVSRTPVFITPLSATPVSQTPAIPTPSSSVPAFDARVETPVQPFAAIESAADEAPAVAQPVSHPVPHPVSPTPAIGSAAFVTETMAELLVSQGFTSRAVDVYEELVRRRPYDPVLTSRLAELREFLATPVVPAHPTPRSETPVVSEAIEEPIAAEIPASATPVASTVMPSPTHSATPVYSTPVSFTPVATTVVQHGTPISATPIGVRTISATPLSNTPLSATPIHNAPIAATPIAIPALNDNAEVPQWRTARQRFAELAGRRVPRRTPPRATAVVDEPTDGLASLFGASAANSPDDTAARALADAFGPVSEGGPSLFEPEMATGAMRATPMGMPAVATPQSQRATGGNTDFSFDRFFPDPAKPVSASGANAALSNDGSAVQPPAQSGEDLAQFSAWLKGLANP